jgi:hypothetical protein
VSLAGVGPGLCSAGAIDPASALAWSTPARLVSDDVIDIGWRHYCRVATRVAQARPPRGAGRPFAYRP